MLPPYQHQKIRTLSPWRPLLSALLLALSFFATTSFAMDYYVDATATTPNEGEGTMDKPYNNLGDVNTQLNTMAPGDRMLFKKGSDQVFNPDPSASLLGLLLVKVTGELGNPIYIGTSDSWGSGAAPIIDGTGTVTRTWSETGVGTNIYTTSYTVDDKIIAPNFLLYNSTVIPPLVTLKFTSRPPELSANAVLIRRSDSGSFWVRNVDGDNVSGITIKEFSAGEKVYFRYVENGEEKTWSGPDLTIQGVISSGAETEAALTAYGQDGQWYWDGSTSPGKIYLYSTVDPTTITKVPWASDAIRIENSNYAVLEGLQIRNMNKQGVVLLGSNNITVQNMDIKDCGRTGIQMWTSSSNTIQQNIIDFVSGAISLYAQPSQSSLNNNISNNIVSNCRGACIGLSRDNSTSTLSGNIISANTITNANTTGYDGAGIYTFYAGPGANTLTGNTISDGGSIYLRSAGIMIDWADGPMTITDNTISNNSLTGIALSGSGHKVSDNTLTNNGIAGMGGLGTPRSQINFFNGGVVAANCSITKNSVTADSGHHFITSEAGSCYGHYIRENTYTGAALNENEQFYWPCYANKWIDLDTWMDKVESSSIFIYLNGWIHPKK